MNFRHVLIFVIIFVIISCNKNLQQELALLDDNPIIKKIFLKDIEIRELDAIRDTVNLENYDKVHREKIFELIARNQLKTPLDKYRAAFLLQHTAGKICDGQLTSISPENFLLAYHLSSTALSELKAINDTATIKNENVPRMVALNYDRYLLFRFGYQKYGTQFVFDEKTGEMLLGPIDTTLANDNERLLYNVQPLNILLSKYKMKAFVKE